MSILNLDRDQPGFRSNSKYGNEWFGVLLETHPDFSGKSSTKKDLSTSDRFDLSKNLGDKSFTGPYSTRDYMAMFGDTATDYFRHGLQVIDSKNLRLSNFTSTPYENNDPVFFGFELIIDGVSSPLLIGSVEDFFDQFSNISEIVKIKSLIY